MGDCHDDDLDGVLFRFWIRAASYPGGWPHRLSELFRKHTPPGENMQAHHYRAALTELAMEKGINLPMADRTDEAAIAEGESK